MFRILCSNLGYGRNIDGTWQQHLGNWHRYLYTTHACQQESLGFLKETMADYQPHLSCFLEIDQGSALNGYLNQLDSLTHEDIHIASATNKYGPPVRASAPPAEQAGTAEELILLDEKKGKSNGFLSTVPLTYRKHFFRDGFKRLIYEIETEDNLTVFLVHLALSRRIRRKQLIQLAALSGQRKNPTMIIGDFNIFAGREELKPLTGAGDFVVVNDLTEPTFRLGSYEVCVDLCLATPSLAARTSVKVLDQPCSDHQILLIEVGD